MTDFSASIRPGRSTSAVSRMILVEMFQYPWTIRFRRSEAFVHGISEVVALKVCGSWADASPRMVKFQRIDSRVLRSSFSCSGCQVADELDDAAGGVNHLPEEQDLRPRRTLGHPPESLREGTC